MSTTVSPPALSRAKPPILNALTGIRALGAWWVVIFHLQPELRPLTARSSFLSSFAGAGHIGVTLFFILSGFILSYNYAKTFESLSRLNYSNFLGQRLARIYPVHLVTLLALLLLVITATLAGQPFSPPEKYSIGKFFAHILLINGWTVPIETSWNGVAWTLSVEWLCYLIFPVLSVLTFNLQKPSISIFFIAFILVMAFYISPPGGIYEVLMFVVGVFLGRLHLSQFGKGFNWELIVIVSSLAIVLLGSSLAKLGLGTSAIAIFMVMLIYGLSWGDNFTAKLMGSNIMIYWGYASYSLYMTHPIVLRLLRNVVPFDPSKQAALHLLLVLSIYVVSMAIAARLTYVLVEEPGRIWIKKSINTFKA